MNRLLLSSMVLLGIATNAYAFESVARVVNTAPIVETVNHPTQNCWTEYQPSAQYHPPEHSYGGAVVGGIAGGLLGSRFGEGNGRVASAAVGAAVGAITGDRIDNRDRGEYTTTQTPVRRCASIDHYETRTSGYRVTYEYEGRQFQTTLPYDPGPQLHVNVSVTPR